MLRRPPRSTLLPYPPLFRSRLAQTTGLPLTAAPSRVAAQGSRDALVELSGQLRNLAVALHKIASDIRLMASGPMTGLAEIRLPAGNFSRLPTRLENSSASLGS